MAELSATFDEITNPSYQADPLATRWPLARWHPLAVGEYRFGGIGVAQEKARLFFPRSGLPTDRSFNFAYRMEVGEEGVTVHVAQVDYPVYSPVYYHLDRDLSLRAAVFSDVFLARAWRTGLDLGEEQRKLRRIETVKPTELDNSSETTTSQQTGVARILPG